MKQVIAVKNENGEVVGFYDETFLGWSYPFEHTKFRKIPKIISKTYVRHANRKYRL